MRLLNNNEVAFAAGGEHESGVMDYIAGAWILTMLAAPWAGAYAYYKLSN